MSQSEHAATFFARIRVHDTAGSTVSLYQVTIDETTCILRAACINPIVTDLLLGLHSSGYFLSSIGFVGKMVNLEILSDVTQLFSVASPVTTIVVE